MTTLTGYPTSTWSVESLTALINTLIGNNDFAGATITTSTVNSTPIGGTVPAAGAFTTLTASNTVTFSPASHNVVLSPSGTGVVTINPATAGAMDKMNIGANTAGSGAFTTLSASDAVALSPSSKNVVLSPTGSGVVTINPATAGTLDNLAIGATTPLAGKFTNATVTGFYDSSVGTGLTAAGTSRTDALALTKAVNNVTTVTASTGVILPASATVGIGGIVTVFNAGASAAQVYGAGSDTIDTVSGATGVPLTNGKRCIYIVVAANTYISAQLGVVSA